MSKPKVVRNPYASTNKKSSSMASSTATSTSYNKRAHHSNIDGDDFFLGSNTYSASTFSQAFAAVESSEKYQKEIAILQPESDQKRCKSAKAENRLTNNSNGEIQSAISESNNVGSTGSTEVESLENRRYNHAFLQAHVLHVSPKQRGNSVLKHIRNVPYQYSQIVPDFILGSNRCALFLSLKYHTLHPNYIQRRINELKNDFSLRVLLCLVDMDDNAAIINALNKTAVFHNLSLILAWSNEEAARECYWIRKIRLKILNLLLFISGYLETFKAYESKDSSSIQKREKESFADQIADVLTSIRSVNKTDSSYLVAQFGTFKQLVGASMDELSLCHGIGERKVQRLFNAFNKPFRKKRLKCNDTNHISDTDDTKLK